MTLPEDITSRNTDGASALPAGDADPPHDEIDDIKTVPIESEPLSTKTVLRNPNHVCDSGAAFIKTYLRARRDREWQFPRGLFSDPAWDILLELYVAQSEGRPVTVRDACKAASVPETSGTRWLRILESRHLVKREGEIPDQNDATVSLTRDAIAGMNRWLDRMLPLPAPDRQRS
jgi:hypothetical protein